MTIRRPFKEIEASRPAFEEDYPVHFTKVPDAEWRIGSGLNGLRSAKDFDPQTAQWRRIVPSEHPPPALYKLMISAIIPRPIAFLSTMDLEGRCNLSPFSYFNMVASNPPTVMVSVQANKSRPSRLKDSSHNIKQLEQFCISMISEPFLEAANVTSTDAPPEIEEWDLSGLHKRESQFVKPPHVAEAAFSMECELVHWYELLGDDQQLASTVILGRIKCFHGKEFVFDPEDPMRVMPERLQAVSRLGGVTYGRTLQMAEALRPTWEEVQASEEYQKLAA